MKKLKFPMSDNWWIEENKAYFCGTKIGALFCVDLESRVCRILDCIPECDFENYRLYPHCIKYKDKIFCLPYMGQCIWVYDTNKVEWHKIELSHSKHTMICPDTFNQNNHIIRFLEYESNEIHELDLINEKINNRHLMPESQNIFTGEYVLVENRLYSFLGNQICCINMKSGETEIYKLTNINNTLYTMCFDGKNFWISGYFKEIYVWNPKEGVIKVIDDYLKSFFEDSVIKKYLLKDHPFFSDSVALGKYIWHIPFQFDAEIIYTDKESYRSSILHIEEEKESENSLNKRFSTIKYMVEYVREGRYIGIYSYKNQYIFEIDTVELCVINREYILDEESKDIMMQKHYKKNMILFDKNEIDVLAFSVLLRKDFEERNAISENIGKRIYQNVKYGFNEKNK